MEEVKKQEVVNNVDIEKLWNWNMDESCATSCGNILVAHMHIFNAISLMSFIVLCYFVAFIVNYVQYKNFKVTTESLLFSAGLVYSVWNIFFGLPLREIKGEIKGTENKYTFGYTSHAISQLTAIIFAILILFINEQI